MKKTVKSILSLFFLFFSMSVFAQNKPQQLHIDSFYTNKTDLLIYSVVQEYDSLSQEELNTKIKNWAGLNFVSMKDVLVSETKEQLVFVYITKDFYIKSLMTTTAEWYIRMSVEIKDKKIRISFFDDGNTFWPGSYGQYSVPSTAARTYRLTNYFGKDGKCRKMYTEGLLNLKNSCIEKAESIQNSVSNPQTNIKKDDW